MYNVCILICINMICIMLKDRWDISWFKNPPGVVPLPNQPNLFLILRVISVFYHTKTKPVVDHLLIKTTFPDRLIIQVCKFKYCPHWVHNHFSNISSQNFAKKIDHGSFFLCKAFMSRHNISKMIFGIFHHWHNLLH